MGKLPVTISTAVVLLLGGLYFLCGQIRFNPDTDMIYADEHPRRLDTRGGSNTIEFLEPTKDIGDVCADDVAEFEIAIRNVTDEMVYIESIETTCSCLSATGGVGLKLSPRSDGLIQMSLQPKVGTGRWPLMITVTGGQTFEYVVVGRAYRDVKLSAETLMLGAVVAGSERTVVVSVLGDNDECKFGELSSTADWISAEYVSGEAADANPAPSTGTPGERDTVYRTLGRISLAVTPQVVGDFREFVTCPVTTGRGKRELIVSITGKCTEAIYTIPRRLVFQPDHKPQILLVRSQTDFSISRVEVGGVDVSHELPAGKRRVFRLVIQPPEALFVPDATSETADGRTGPACRIHVDHPSTPILEVPLSLHEQPDER